MNEPLGHMRMMSTIGNPSAHAKIAHMSNNSYNLTMMAWIIGVRVFVCGIPRNMSLLECDQLYRLGLHFGMLYGDEE